MKAPARAPKALRYEAAQTFYSAMRHRPKALAASQNRVGTLNGYI